MLRSHVRVVVKVLAEVGREVQASLLGVASPALLIVLVRQIPAAHPLLEFPEVTPQVEVLQEEEDREVEEEVTMDMYSNRCKCKTPPQG